MYPARPSIRVHTNRIAVSTERSAASPGNGAHVHDAFNVRSGCRTLGRARQSGRARAGDDCFRPLRPHPCFSTFLRQVVSASGAFGRSRWPIRPVGTIFSRALADRSRNAARGIHGNALGAVRRTDSWADSDRSRPQRRYVAVGRALGVVRHGRGVRAVSRDVWRQSADPVRAAISTRRGVGTPRYRHRGARQRRRHCIGAGYRCADADLVGSDIPLRTTIGRRRQTGSARAKDERRPHAESCRRERLAQFASTRRGRCSRARAARRFLDVLVHQLLAIRSVRAGMVREVPRPWVRRAGCAHAGICVRKRHRKRQASGTRLEHHLPGSHR